MRLARNIADEWISVREAAARAGLSGSRIRDWTACGKLDAVRIGRRFHVSAESLGLLLQHRARRRRRPALRLVIDNT